MEENDFLPTQPIIALFSTLPHKRTEQQLEIIMSYIKGNNFLEKICDEHNSDRILWECCRYFTIEIYKRYSPIINFGAIGDKFYIILKGKASVITPNKSLKRTYTLKNNSREKFIRSNSITQLNDSKINVFEEEIEISSIVKQFRRQKTSSNFNLPNFEIPDLPMLKEKDCFGDIALVNRQPQTASIVSMSVLYLAVLSKTDFNRILATHAQKSLEERVKYLKNLPVFNKETDLNLQTLSYSFSEKMYKKDQVIYSDKTAGDVLYFIKNGEVKITHDEVKSKPMYISSDITLKYNLVKSVRKVKIREVIKEKNEIFGYEEIIEGKENKARKCVCFSNFCLLYEVKIEELKKAPLYDQIFSFFVERYKKESLKEGAMNKQNFCNKFNTKEFDLKVKDILNEMKIKKEYFQSKHLRNNSLTSQQLSDHFSIERRHSKEYKNNKLERDFKSTQKVTDLCVIQESQAGLCDEFHRNEIKVGTLRSKLKSLSHSHTESPLKISDPYSTDVTLNQLKFIETKEKKTRFADGKSAQEAYRVSVVNERVSSSYETVNESIYLDSSIQNESLIISSSFISPQVYTPANKKNLNVSKKNLNFSISSLVKQPHTLGKKFLEHALNIKRGSGQSVKKFEKKAFNPLLSKLSFK